MVGLPQPVKLLLSLALFRYHQITRAFNRTKKACLVFCKERKKTIQLILPFNLALAFLENQLKFCVFILLILSSAFVTAEDFTDIDKLGNTAIELIKKGRLNNIVSKTMASSSISKYLSKDDFAQSDGTFERNIKLMGKY